MSKLILVMGCNNAGKTYFIENVLNKEDKCIVLDSLEYQNRELDKKGYGRKDLVNVKDMQDATVTAYYKVLIDVIKFIREGKSVIVEGTFYKVRRRLQHLMVGGFAGAEEFECYFVNPTEEVWKSNTLKRFGSKGFAYSYKEMQDFIDPPSQQEGFNKVYRVSKDSIMEFNFTQSEEYLQEERELIKNDSKIEDIMLNLESYLNKE